MAFRLLADRLPDFITAGNGSHAIAALAAITLVPLVFWFSTQRGERVAALAFALLLGGSLALGISASVARLGFESRGNPGAAYALMLALPIAYVLTPFFGTLRGKAPVYATLFRRAWAQAVIGAIAFAFAGAVLLLNTLLVELLELLSIDLRDVLYDKHWLAGLAGGGFALAIGMAREQENIVHALRGLLLALARTLMPVHLAIVSVFLVASVVQGPTSIRTSISVTALLLTVAALAATFVATALGDATQPIEPRWRRLVARLLAALVVPLSVLAAWSLWVRIDDYGLTPDRLLAAAAVIVAAGHGVGYLWAALRPGFERLVALTNTAMALVAAALGIALLTPWADPTTVSVRDQLARIESGAVSPADVDLAWFAFRSGDVGQRALASIRARPMAAEQPLAARLAALDASDSRYEFERTDSVITALPTLDRLLDDGDLDVVIRQAGATRRLDRTVAAATDGAPLSDAGVTALLQTIEERTRFTQACTAWMHECTVLVSDAPSLVATGPTALFAATRTPSAETGLAALEWFVAGEDGVWAFFDDSSGVAVTTLDPAGLEVLLASLRDGELPLVETRVKALTLGDRLIVPNGQATGN